MKTLTFIFAACMAAAGWPGVGLSQGVFLLDNSQSDYGISLDSPGNYYNGYLGLEVWMHNGTQPGLVDLINTSAPPVALAYYGMLGQPDGYGFSLEATYPRLVMNDGTFMLGTCQMPDVAPAGSTVTVVLAAWNSTAPTMLDAMESEARVGLLCFTQETVDSFSGPAPPVALPRDLVLTQLVPGEVPSVTIQPQVVTALQGDTVYIQAGIGSAYGHGMVMYQWQFNGQDIPGAGGGVEGGTLVWLPQWPNDPIMVSSCSLLLTNLQPGQTGTYSVLVKNYQYGFTGKSWVLLTLMPPFPPLTITAASPGGIALSWPAWAGDFHLETTTDALDPNAVWNTVVAGAPGTAATITVQLDSPGPAAFYRLRK